MNKKVLINISLLIIVIMLLLTGCGGSENANSLYKYAQKTYGDCILISKNETKEKVTIIVHDILQDFDYEVASGMHEINIDGSKFGKVSSKYDTFKENLIDKVIKNVIDNINNKCTNSNISYEFDKENMKLILYTNDENEGKEICIECAEIINKENKNNRIDSFLIELKNNGSHIGSIKLPNIIWRDLEEERIDEFIDYAKLHTDYKAKFLRKELKTYADTGLSLEDVFYYYWEDNYINNMSYPITFYYFESSRGNEYYICDFWYNNGGYPERYTNYEKNM